MARGQQFPAPNEPIADLSRGGQITRSWFATLNSLWQKASGGTVTGSGTAGRLAKWLTSTSLTDALAAANSRLLGSGASGSGAPYSELTLGTNLSMSGTTLNATAGGSGTVTTTGSPASGNLTKFSGATSITNGDLSGDVTTTGTLATTLAASGVTAATYGDATHVAQVTFDAKGRATSATNVAITGSGTVTTTGSPASGNLTKFSGASTITNGDLTGDVTTGGTLATTLANSGASAGTYGSGTTVPQVTVDAKGRITAVSSVAIGGGGGGGGVGGLQGPLEEHTASASATLDFTTCLTASYDHYLFTFIDLSPTTNTQNLVMQVSADGGATWFAGSYFWAAVTANNSAAPGGANGTTSSLLLFPVQDNSIAGIGVSGHLEFFNPLAIAQTTLIYDIWGNDNAFFWRYAGSGYVNSVATTNAVRFKYASGTIARGTIRCYGYAV